jgi:hypothetical protein
MTVDTKGTSITDFWIGKDDRQRLIADGESTARAFLADRGSRVGRPD